MQPFFATAYLKIIVCYFFWKLFHSLEFHLFFAHFKFMSFKIRCCKKGRVNYFYEEKIHYGIISLPFCKHEEKSLLYPEYFMLEFLLWKFLCTHAIWITCNFWSIKKLTWYWISRLQMKRVEFTILNHRIHRVLSSIIINFSFYIFP